MQRENTSPTRKLILIAVIALLAALVVIIARNNARNGATERASALQRSGVAPTDPDQRSASSSATSSATQTIRICGSDSMIRVAQDWAEAYRKVEPGVSVRISGGGSAVGVAALINGTCDIANSTRALQPEEIQKIKARRGQEPRQFSVTSQMFMYTPGSPPDHVQKFIQWVLSTSGVQDISRQ